MAFGRIKKLPVENDKNYRYQGRSYIEDKERSLQFANKDQNGEFKMKNTFNKSYADPFLEKTKEIDLDKAASDYLEGKGIKFPRSTEYSDHLLFMDAIRDYSAQHSTLVAQFKRQPKEVPKPVVKEPVGHYYWMD